MLLFLSPYFYFPLSHTHTYTVDSDFVELDALVTFPAGSVVGTMRSVFFTAVDDLDLEDIETATVVGTIASGSALFTSGMETDETIVMILDDDLTFIDNTPDTNGNSITTTLNLNGLVTSASCTLAPGGGTQDCKYDVILAESAYLRRHCSDC